jgi:hypothetical protein
LTVTRKETKLKSQPYVTDSFQEVGGVKW